MTQELKPTSFGVIGLAAALSSDPERVRALVRAGAIRAEFVEAREPRWSASALADVIKQLLPVSPDNNELALERAAIGLSALDRAWRAEFGGVQQEVDHG